MNRKVATSDLHFGHANIFKFSRRFEEMRMAGFVNEDTVDCYDALICGFATNEVKRVLAEDHDRWLLQHINRQLNDSDTVYHLGDFSFYKAAQYDKLKYVIDNLKGTWIFVLGNHDNESKLREAVKGTRHKVVGHYHEIHVNKKFVVLMHYPIEEWNKAHHGAYMLHGHLHGTKGHGDWVLRDIPKRFDMGIDAHPEHLIFDLEQVVV